MTLKRLPSELSCTVNEQQCFIELQIDADITYFKGHFNNSPILPGVVQIAWAEHWGKKKLAVAGKFSRMEAIKFKQIIQPGTRLTLQLSYSSDSGKLTFVYSNEAGEKSSGRLIYE